LPDMLLEHAWHIKLTKKGKPSRARLREHDWLTLVNNPPGSA